MGLKKFQMEKLYGQTNFPGANFFGQDIDLQDIDLLFVENFCSAPCMRITTSNILGIR